MQFKINFESNQDIILPFQYNHILQASLLSALDDQEYAHFVHDVGYKYEKRVYKLYTFSRIIGQVIIDKERKTFNFKKSCALYVASMDEKFTYSIFLRLLNDNAEIRWLNNFVKIKSIEVIDTKTDGGEIIVKAISPITVRSTLYTAEGRPKSYFYHPNEIEFEKNIAENLRKKYFAFYGEDLAVDDFRIQALRDIKECNLSYKGGLVKGYKGVYQLTGSKELFHTALSSGIGEQGSMGFGMVLLQRR